LKKYGSIDERKKLLKDEINIFYSLFSNSVEPNYVNIISLESPKSLKVVETVLRGVDSRGIK
jgi:hypothetical protein